MKHKGPSLKEPSASCKHYVDGGVGEGPPVTGTGLVHIPREGTEKCNINCGEGSGVIQDAIWLDSGIVAFQG